MSDQLALLAAIRENPDEDTPRLAYADLLDENATSDGDRARAEFIRVQIELAKLPNWGWGFDEDEFRGEELRVREKQLLDLHRMRWLHPARLPTKGFKPDGITFRRGFPEEGFFRIDELRDYAPDILSYPLLRALRVSCINRYSIDELIAFPWLDEVRELELIPHREPFGPPDWSKLADCPHFLRLKSLDLGNEAAVTRPAAQRIATNVALAGVQELRFWEQPREDALSEMLSGLAFHSLRSLEVCVAANGDFPPSPLSCMGDNPKCSDLKSLRLQGYAVRADAVESITQSAFWPGLRELRLVGDVFEPAAIEVLGAATGHSLHFLELYLNGATSGSLASLVAIITAPATLDVSHSIEDLPCHAAGRIRSARLLKTSGDT